MTESLSKLAPFTVSVNAAEPAGTLDGATDEMDGVAALRAIREKMPQVKALVSSGYTSPEKAQALEALGIDGFVRKPFEVVKLATAIRDVLDGVAV